MHCSRPPMKNKKLSSDLQSCVLAALAADPLDQARLFESVFRSKRGDASYTLAKLEAGAPEFFDALSLLQADGLVSEKPHPLREFRRYYLTEKGNKIARRLEIGNRKHARVREQSRELIGR